jgi:hypothetical protein
VDPSSANGPSCACVRRRSRRRTSRWASTTTCASLRCRRTDPSPRLTRAYASASPAFCYLHELPCHGLTLTGSHRLGLSSRLLYLGSLPTLILRGVQRTGVCSGEWDRMARWAPTTPLCASLPTTHSCTCRRTSRTTHISPAASRSRTCASLTRPFARPTRSRSVAFPPLPPPHSPSVSRSPLFVLCVVRNTPSTLGQDASSLRLFAFH